MPHDWRDSLRLAADLALLGILVTLAALPVLTAGAAVGTGSAAIHRLITTGRWPTVAEFLREFRLRLVPGLPAGPVVLAAAGLIVLDLVALRRGAVPGGRAGTAAVLAAAALGAGFLALTAGLAGRAIGGSVRRARSAAAAHPATLAAMTGIVVLVALLAVVVHPVLVPILVGYALFALHAVLVRTPAGAGPLSSSARGS